MFLASEDKCIGCSLCINDCLVRAIRLEDNKARINNKKCMECGHCIAVCPTNAVKATNYDMNEVIEYKKEDFDLNGDNLLNFIKFRRSIRNFKDKDVENEKIEKIIQAGRYTQTARNSQDVSYIVIKNKEEKEKLRVMVMESLNELGETILNNLTPENKHFEKYARMWVIMYKEYLRNKDAKDNIFFGAPTVILVTSKTPINGGLASTNMELMTNALGLGTFYSGFLVRASQNNKKIREFLNLESKEEIITCLVLGYPNVKYQRTVPRKTPKITWI